jgi:AcrR family transcriptional regulator
MSENDSLHLVASKKKTDARVRRTRDALGDALVALMQEKPFDTITVQDVLDRAKVGRSTFYSHYSDKDDLLMSDAEEFFESVAMLLSLRGDGSDRVFPVREFFSHIAEAKQFVDALVSSGKFNDNMELARGLFARGIEQRLSELPRGRGIPADERAAIAFAHAGALLSLLTWWIDRGMRQPPAQMDQLFHKMVWTGVES